VAYFIEKKTYVQDPSANRELNFDLYFALFYSLAIAMVLNPVFLSVRLWIENFEGFRPIFGGALGKLPPIIQVPLMLVAMDMVFYWKHRLDHAWKPMWVFHLFHHHQEHLNFLSGSRTNLFNTAMIRFVCIFTFLLLGFDNNFLFIFGAVYAVIVSVSHVNTKIRIRWLECIVTTPHVHRWHHSLDTPDKNFALIFPFIDIMFGTFYRPDHAPTRMGVETPKVKNSIIAYHAYPFIENYKMIASGINKLRCKITGRREQVQS
jgi:sterol desaturase/sphingolipid hydroxylase (fatty acid hydroxylase superfamily)